MSHSNDKVLRPRSRQLSRLTGAFIYRERLTVKVMNPAPRGLQASANQRYNLIKEKHAVVKLSRALSEQRSPRSLPVNETAMCGGGVPCVEEEEEEEGG